MGRPSKFTPEIADTICDLISQGKTLIHICSLDDFPHHATVCRWLREDEAFRDNYARARQEQADYFADEVIAISDTEPDPQVARVRMDARKWHASKTAPKKYGDKIEQEISGSVTIEVVRFGGKDDPNPK
jgi:hypothetical protein